MFYSSTSLPSKIAISFKINSTAFSAFDEAENSVVGLSLTSFSQEHAIEENKQVEHTMSLFQSEVETSAVEAPKPEVRQGYEIEVTGAEMALVSGVDKVVQAESSSGTFNFKEVIAQQITSFLDARYDLIGSNLGVEKVLDLGDAELLMTGVTNLTGVLPKTAVAGG